MKKKREENKSNKWNFTADLAKLKEVINSSTEGKNMDFLHYYYYLYVIHIS